MRLIRFVQVGFVALISMASAVGQTPYANLPTTSPKIPWTVPELPAEKVEVPLPGPVRRVAIGGAGRFLIFQQPKGRRLAIFDVGRAKVTDTIPLREPGALFTAGLHKLVVVNTESRLAERYDLMTGQRESIALLPAWDISGVVIGSGSAGTILVQRPLHPWYGYIGEPRFLDLETFRPIRVSRDYVLFAAAGLHHVRASTDGRTFGFSRPNVSPSGSGLLVYGQEKLSQRDGHEDRGHVMPSADGRFVCCGRGVLDLDWPE